MGGSNTSTLGSTDTFNSVATDSSGNVYATGATGFDEWIVKYNSNGTLLWKRELGTSGFDTSSNGVATDSNGNVYISGSTDLSFAGNNRGLSDAWVAKYSSSGTQLWKRQLGTSESDTSNGVATDSNGNVYISGNTDGSLAGTNNQGTDAWVAKYNTSGTQLWTEQLGLSTANVFSTGVATDSNGNVYIAGSTNGSLAGTNNQGIDSWVAKYNTSGTQLWRKQLGLSTANVSSRGVATDINGNVYISGFTNGSLAGTNTAGVDAWVAKYNTSGTQLWTEQLGLSGPNVSSYGVATDRSSNVYIAGDTNGNLAAQNSGKIDAWLAKYTQ